MITYAIVTKPQLYLYASPEAAAIDDEIFSGWAVAVREECVNGYVLVETHYGYQGYARREALHIITEEELRDRQDKYRFQRVQISCADLLSLPKVQGLPGELLLKGAIVEVTESAETGFCKVRSASGQEGYVHAAFLSKRKDTDGYLLGTKTSGAMERRFFKQNAEEVKKGKLFTEKDFTGEEFTGKGFTGEEFTGKGFTGEEFTGKGFTGEEFMRKNLIEETIRASLIQSAKQYLGTQYRWGGKSALGMDCSGLAFMSYLENGILIYRDAQIVEEYPIHQITRQEARPGDLLFFPGHVAVYLGNQRYIHSTGHEKDARVTINSFDPFDESYREDLDQKCLFAGSIF